MYTVLVWLVLEYHPSRSDAEQPLLLEEMQALNDAGQGEAVTAMIRMIIDLQTNGRDSRFIRALRGLPVFELKTMSRGKLKGGARVYFFLGRYGEAHLVNCEVKDGDEPSTGKLKVAVLALRAYERKLADEEEQDAD